MNKTLDRSTQTVHRQRIAFETKVSPYDVFQAMLTSLVVLTGFFAGSLFLIWLTTVLAFKPKPASVTISPNPMVRGEHGSRSALDTEIPGEELSDMPQSQISVALQAMSDAIAMQTGSIAAFKRNDRKYGNNKGDEREKGMSPGENSDVIPPWKRWKVQFAAASQDDYARQLDALKIELGALSRNSPEIQYASKLSTQTPDSRSESRNNESRLFFVHLQNDPLITFSRGLLQNAGIDTEDRLIAQFYSDDAYSKLQAVEKSRLGNRSLASVRKTVFGVRKAGSKYEFYVIRYEFLP